MLFPQLRFKQLFSLIGVFLLLPAGPALAQRSTLVSTNAEAFGRFGWSVAAAGDVDHDGTPDVLVGAYGEDPSGWEESGRAYLFSGSDGSLIRILTSPNSVEKGQFGWSVATAGDMNGDGTSDVFVGAPGETVSGASGSGRVYLFSGSDGSLLHTFISANPAKDSHFGRSIASGGDVDGDGIPDVLVGAPEEDSDAGQAEGRVYLFSGSDGSLIHTLGSPHSKEGGQFGGAIGLAGDLNGDATPDILVGAYAEDADGVSGSGRAYLFSGSDGSLIHVLASSHAQVDGFFGYSVTQSGDINGDGTPEVLVGALAESAEGFFRSGRVYLFSGVDGTLMRTLISPNAEADGFFGGRMSEAGDINSDGIPDLLISAFFETADGFSFSGQVHIFSGADASLIRTLVSPNAEQLGYFGGAIALAGDMDHDGTPDLFVGAPHEDVGGFFESDRTYVLSGRTGTVVPIEEQPSLPQLAHLDPPFPNPFTNQTHLRLRLERAQQVNISVYDLMGRCVVMLHDGWLASGEHTFTLSGSPLPSGVYHIRMAGARFTTSQQAILLR